MTSKNFRLVAIAITTLFLTALSFAANTAYSSPAVQGYDLVSYHTTGKPLPGTGMHTAEHDGETYLFVSKAHKKAFENNPQKYIPAYGGYCAYGVAVGKKFVGDPTVWELVNGKLYLNLNKEIQGTWAKDIKGNISKANKSWGKIKNKDASTL